MRALFFLISIFFSSYSFSDPYSFGVSNGSNIGSGATPELAFLDLCNQHPDWVGYGFCSKPGYRIDPLPSSTSFWVFTFFSHGPQGGRYTISRYGDSCPNPETQTYNPATGECEDPDKCSATEGMGAGHMFLANTRTNPYDPWPDGSVESPYSVCRAGCRFTADVGDGKVKCGTLPGQSPLQQYCVRVYTGTGQECVAGDDPLFSGPGLGGGGDPDGEAPPSDDPLDFPPLIDPNADPTDPSNTCGPGYVWTGTTCAKIFNEKDPTTPGGGGSNGGGDGGDGGDPGGDPGGNGNGDGGTGTGTGGGGGGRDKANVKGVSCADERPVECSGDAYDCAIFWHTREQNCRMEKLLDYSDQQKQDISELFDSDDYRFVESDEEVVELEGFINKRTRFLPSSCPPPIAIALSGRTYQLDTGPFCSFADALGYLIVAFASLAGALYVGRAFGGE